MIPRIFLFSFFICILLSISIEAASLPKATTEQEAIVIQLYKDFSWEVVMHHTTLKGLLEQPREILEKYFDGKLTSLILQDRACAKKKGMCK